MVWFGSCWSFLIELLLVLLVSVYIIMSCVLKFLTCTITYRCVFFQFLCVTSSYLNQNNKTHIINTFKIIIEHYRTENHNINYQHIIFTGWWFQICSMFTPKIGEEFQFDEHIFQMGWFNHQQVIYTRKKQPEIVDVFLQGWTQVSWEGANVDLHRGRPQRFVTPKMWVS